MDVGTRREALGEEIAPAGTQQVLENERHRKTQMLTELRIETVLIAESLELQCLIGFLRG